MTHRRRYVDALDGQMHVIEAGEGQAIILLPWFPRSALMYLDELEAFSARGYRAIALDLMGRGNSITHNHSISIKRHADNVEHVLASMGVQNPVVLGGHYSSQIAAELALRPSIGARALVIDGGIMITDAVSDNLVEQMMRVPMALLPQEDGSHRSFLWDNAANIYDIYAPGYQPTNENAHVVYRAMSDFLAAYLQTGGKSLNLPPNGGYPFAETLAKLTIPAVFLSSKTEPLVSSVEPMEKTYGGPFQTHMFKGDHPLHFPDRAGEYAATLCDILDEVCVSQS